MTATYQKVKTLLLSPQWQTHQSEILALPTVRLQAEMFESKVRELLQMPKLAKYNLVDAVISFITQPITESSDLQLHQNLITWLSVFAVDQNIQNAACTTWFNHRSIVLENLILENDWTPYQSRNNEVYMYVALKKNQGPFDGYYAHYHNLTNFMLLEKACQDEDPQIAARAKEWLQSWVDILEEYWRHYRDNLDIVERYLKPLPTSIEIILTLQGPYWESLTAASAEDIPHIVRASDTDQEEMLANIRYVLENLEQEEAHQALCRMVTEGDWPIAEAVTVGNDYQPTGLPAHQQSLYYFLTEQWERYEEVDFDGRLLAIAYQAANTELRYRLVEKIRRSGQTSYLNIIKDYHITANAAPVEIEILIEMLVENKQWEKLWHLALSFDLEGSVAAIQKLTQASWRSKQNATQVIFEQLRNLASGPLLNFHQIGEWQIDGVKVATQYGLLGPLSQINLAQLSELNRVLQNQEVSQATSNTLRYIEVVLNYRFQDGIELGEAFEVIPSKFDIEIEG
jgi:hypothetical protein